MKFIECISNIKQNLSNFLGQGVPSIWISYATYTINDCILNLKKYLPLDVKQQSINQSKNTVWTICENIKVVLYM